MERRVDGLLNALFQFFLKLKRLSKAVEPISHNSLSVTIALKSGPPEYKA